MRISTIIVMWVGMCAGLTYADKSSAQRLKDYKLSVTFGNETLHQALQKISRETRLSFAYDEQALSVVSVTGRQFINEPLDRALGSLLGDTGYQFEVINNNIVITKKIVAKPQKPGKVTGKVTDAETGEPLVGATVEELRTGKYTQTDEEGLFELTLAAGYYQLTLSYIGYEPLKLEGIDIRSDAIMTRNGALRKSANQLDDVIVIGYGTQTKRDLTGAYSAVSGEAISNRKTTQLSTALQGTMPGVMVTRTNSSPGASATIRIRGITSIGNTNPLIMVDGIYVPNIDDVNPNDVESLTVLKDAASAAIYGSRAASGVILITTKRGKNDHFSLNYSSEYGISQPTASPEYVNVVRFMEMENELRWNDAGNGANEYPAYPKETVENYYNLHKESPDDYPITDWEGLMLRRQAPRQTHNLSVSGGTNAVKTNASFIYDHEDGLYINRNFHRVSTRINNDFNISRIISAAADVYFKRSSYVTPVSVPNELMRVMPSIFPAQWANGGIADGKGGENPYAALLFGGTDNQKYTQVGGRINVDIKPFEGLKLSGAIAPKYNFDQGKQFTKN